MINNSQNAWWFRLGLWVLGSLMLADTICAQNMMLSLNRRDFQVGNDNFPFSMAVGDFNGDGHLDLATANGGGQSVSILLGRGDGSFGAAQDFDVGETLGGFGRRGEPLSVTMGDFNGDGHLDLATANKYFPFGGSLSILLGQGDGTFSPAQDFDLGSGFASLTPGNFNGDGHLDLADFDDDGVLILLGQGDGTFSPAQNLGVGNSFTSGTAEDFNGDGHLDLATAKDEFGTGGSVSILLGRGDGSFIVAQNFGVGEYPSSVTVGDFNGDGHLDLATANGGSQSVSILLGRGDGSFGAAQNFGVGDYPSSVTVGDFNGDNHLDLATANRNANSVSIFLGHGDGTFGVAQDFDVSEYPQFIMTGDFNGDGQLDLTTANLGTSSVSILMNVTTSGVAEGVADVITFEGLEAGARLSEVYGSRGSGPVVVRGTNPLLSSRINAAVVFDSACPPGGIPRDCTGEDSDLGTPNEAVGGPGVGLGGMASNDTALGKVLIIAENVNNINRDERVDDPDDASQGGTLHLDFSALGSVTMHAITFVDLDEYAPAQKVEFFHGGVTGTLLATISPSFAGDNGVSVLPFHVPGVNTVVITLTDSAAIDNITFIPESVAAGQTKGETLK